MNKSRGIGFPMGLLGGIILGAVIDNMAFGIIAGLIVGFGIIKFGGDADS